MIRLSWNQLRNAQECKQKRYLAVTGARKPARDQRLFLPGNVTDRVVRSWLKDPNRQPGQMPEMVSSTIDAVRTEILEKGERIAWKKDLEDRNNVRKDCIEAVQKIEPLLLKHVTPFEFEADFKFEAPLSLPRLDGSKEVILLIGFMDIIVRDDLGQMFVYDVKHTRDGQYWRKTVGQLTFYDLATLLLFKKKTTETALFQPLCARPVHTHPVSNEDRAQLYQRITSTVNDIWTNDNTPRADNKICPRCDFRNACPKFAPVLKDGKMRVII